MIKPDEVAAVLRQALLGSAVQLSGLTERWAVVYCGNVQFLIGGWKITIFNDCDDLDYVDSAESPDGRRATYDDWWDETGEGRNPLELLNEKELSDLEELLRSARD